MNVRMLLQAGHKVQDALTPPMGDEVLWLPGCDGFLDTEGLP